MTLTELITQVRRCIARDSNAFDDAWITDAINTAQRRVAELRTWQEMRMIFERTTVSGQMRYTLPDRMKELYYVNWVDNGSSKVLVGMMPEVFNKAEAYPDDDSGTPSVYVLFHDHILLWNVPDEEKTIRIRCAIYPEDLSDGSDESDLNEKDHLIIPVAVHECLLQLGELEDAETWYSRVFMERFREAVERDKRFQRTAWDGEGSGFLPKHATYDPEVPLP